MISDSDMRDVEGDDQIVSYGETTPVDLTW